MIVSKKSTQLDQELISKFSHDTGIERVTMHIYLGCPIHEDFSINPRIIQITKRLNPIIGILSKLKWNLPSEMLLKIYYAHVHSHLSNIPQILSAANQQELNSLQILQNRALKHVFKLTSRFPSLELYRDVTKRILPVRAIIRLTTCVLIHKAVLEMIKTELKFEKSKKGLRNDGNLVPMNCYNSTFMINDITCSGVKMYNNIPMEIRNLTNVETFKTKLKLFLLQNIESFF